MKGKAFSSLSPVMKSEAASRRRKEETSHTGTTCLLTRSVFEMTAGLLLASIDRSHCAYSPVRCQLHLRCTHSLSSLWFCSCFTRGECTSATVLQRLSFSSLFVVLRLHSRSLSLRLCVLSFLSLLCSFAFAYDFHFDPAAVVHQ